MTSFTDARDSLGALDADAAAALISAAADVTLILGEGGVIRDIAAGSDDLGRALAREALIGRAWADTVAEDSRPKIGEILADAAANAPPRWRHVNQIGGTGAPLPLLVHARRLPGGARTVVFGRDLRPIADLQQRLVEAQASLERDYSRLRQAETRYRLLFQTAAEPVLIADAASGRIIEANPAAAGLSVRPARRLIGTPLLELFDPASRPGIETLLAALRITGRADAVVGRLAGRAEDSIVSATLFRQDGATLLLVRFVQTPGDETTVTLPRQKSKLLTLIDASPDGFVVTDGEGRVLAANAAFLEMTQLAAEEQARGETLDRWLGRSRVDLDVLLATLRGGAPVRLFATTLRGAFAATREVEISAAAVVNSGSQAFGFTIRDVGPRRAPPPQAGAAATRSVEQLTELIGRVPLKELVREATDVIERLCIEAALELTNDNRASAAEMLGLSRQSLYVKLRRYGLIGPDDGGEGD
ncbi:transcriptional regulator PpsR [Elioraea sp.]|uniref:transcriptional regulator PpsR n=1 Tax=Elioraea sp. TaxID=2185103 RepID=UPI0021DC43B5|nr:transcriptional regulator PpsR [Elioraea sp.]GIX09045.1 MAG: transcriptional regulator PpsR [Elioraea sp.]